MAANIILFVCCCINAVLLGVQGETDYYEVLGVARSASNEEIRASYKKLAREWHPDKNRSPEAAQRFMEIKEAYEVLSDETARRRYDNRGSGYFDFDDPFNIVITPFSRRRTFKSRVDIISSDFFFNTVLPDSHSKPYLLYFFSEFDCFLCLNMDTVWDRVKKEPSLSGVGMATLSTRTMDVLDFVGVVDVPAIVSVVDEHIYYYRHIYYPSVTGVTQFLTATLPKSTFTAINSDNLVSFLGTAVLSNKPRLIIVSPKPHPQPHHLLVAMKYRHFIAFGFVSTAKGLNDAVARHLKVPMDEEASIVFKESSQNAAGRSPTGSSELFRFAKRHTLLKLPRLSSPEHYKAVCNTRPSSGCLVLVVSGPTQYTSERVDSWRSLHTSQPKAYVDASWQNTFLQSMNFTSITSVTCDDGDGAWKVLGFRWHQRSLPSYAWMEWCPEMSPALLVAHQWTVVEGSEGEGDPSHLLDDENGPGFLQRLWLKCETWFMRSSNSFKAFALAYPQVLMSMLMMVPLLCMLTLRQGEPFPDQQQQQQTANRQDDDFLGFSESSTEEHEEEPL